MTPSNEILKDILKNNPEKFLSNEIELRKKNKLPPFSRLISFIISAHSKDNSTRGAEEIKKKLLKISSGKLTFDYEMQFFKSSKKR